MKLKVVAAAVLLCTGAAMAQQGVFGRNLLTNGDAEAGPSDPNGYQPVSSIPGWTISGASDVVQYASGYIVGPKDVGPLNRGSNYFSGGRPASNSSLTQTVDLSGGASNIDTGTVTFTVSAYLGGWESEPESAQVTVTFLNASGGTLTSGTIAPVTNTDRENSIGLVYRRSIGPVPAGARSAKVVLQFNAKGSNTNDAVADNVSLVLNQAADPQSLLGNNLIVNGNAETLGVADPTMVDTSTIDVPGWNRISRFTVDSYNDVGGDLDMQSPGPADRGNYFFYGGDGEALSSAWQDIDVSSASAMVDSGSVSFALSAWLGGYAGQGDNMLLTLQFMDWNGAGLGTVKLGPPSSDDRGGVSSLLPYSQSGGVPAGTRMVRITMTSTRTDGGDNDGLADNLSLVLSSAGGGSAPSVGSVVSASAFGGFPSIGGGAWIEIYGTHLASEARGWGTADFNGSTAPTSLSGVKVQVAGQAAYVAYVSPTQVNALVPGNVAAGQQTLVVSNGGGNSNSYSVNVKASQPGLLAPSSFATGGKQYVTAFLPDGSFALPQGGIAGLNGRPARPGETITIYGIGFGGVTPNIPIGQLVGQTNDLAQTMTMQFGSTPASLQYKGLAPDLVGVYQFNVVVPEMADSDAVPLSFSLGGQAGTQTLWIAVHH